MSLQHQPNLVLYPHEYPTQHKITSLFLLDRHSHVKLKLHKHISPNPCIVNNLPRQCPIPTKKFPGQVTVKVMVLQPSQVILEVRVFPATDTLLQTRISHERMDERGNMKIFPHNNTRWNGIIVLYRNTHKIYSTISYNLKLKNCRLCYFIHRATLTSTPLSTMKAIQHSIGLPQWDD